MENKETGKRVVTNEELMQKIEGLEKNLKELIQTLYLHW